jgi:hypothetical protein
MEKTKGPNGDTSAAKRLCGAPRSADSGVGPRNHLLISGRGEELPPEQSLEQGVPRTLSLSAPRAGAGTLSCAFTSAAVIATLLVAAGCGPSGSHQRQPTLAKLTPLRLLPVSALDESFIWEQRVTASWKRAGAGKQPSSGSAGFDAVLQRRGDQLLLVGLSPMKTPGFIVTYQNGRVSFKNNSKRRLPFSPRYMIADVQLAFFPWLGPQNQAGFTGKRSGVRGRLLIEEHYKKGRLSRRVFRRRDAPGLGQVVVEYSGWQAGQSAPRKTVLRSGWYGYRLTIETLTQRRL